jgi:hypothetical protein
MAATILSIIMATVSGKTTRMGEACASQERSR